MKAVANTVMYNRKGQQPSAAPVSIRSVFKTASGLNVACHDDLGPVSSLAFVVKAGSRNEALAAPGVAHVLKTALYRVFIA